MDYLFIKENVFNTVDFIFDGEIEFFSSDSICVSYDGKKARIGATTPSGIARGCMLLALNITQGKETFDIKQTPRFESLGLMLDCSRNGVMKVSALKRYINFLSSLGYTFLMLYTEDTYELDNRPMFGYLRGRYTKEELREVAEYGDTMGIEVIPCIQTLGHMEQYLKWSKSGGPDYTGEKILAMKDTSSVLLCDEDETYKFIEQIIKTCAEVYKTGKIHIGMDEAHDLGLGRHLRKHGFENRFDIMCRHLKKVVEICEKYDMRPMMWSDMFFRLGTGTYYRYNFDFPETLKENIPDVEIVYWDYYHDRESTYDNMFKKHYELSQNIAFAGGTGCYHGFLPAHDYSMLNSVAALKSCLKHGVKTVFTTIWGDDGNETNALLANSHLAVYSEYCYMGEKCTDKHIARVSEFLTKIRFEDAAKLGNLSFLKNNELLDGNRELYGNDMLIGKRLFYSDILYDMSVNASSCDEIMSVYDSCAERMAELEAKQDVNCDTYHYAYLLYRICSRKAELVKNLRKSYMEGNIQYLREVALENLPELAGWYKELRGCHKRQWMEVYKPFGFEVLGFRYGGVISRVEDARERILDYVEGKIDIIEELEEEIMYNEETFPATVCDLISPSGLL